MLFFSLRVSAQGVRGQNPVVLCDLNLRVPEGVSKAEALHLHGQLHRQNCSRQTPVSGWFLKGCALSTPSPAAPTPTTHTHTDTHKQPFSSDVSEQ